MKFNAQLSYIIPGNFIDWRIRSIPGEKSPVIPRDYKIEGVEEAIKSTGANIVVRSIFSMPEVFGADKLKTAVFEIEKTDKKHFRVLKYVGELQVTTTYNIKR